MADPQNPPPPPDGSGVVAVSATPPPPPDGSAVVASSAIPPPPDEQRGTLGKIWDWANKGLISGKTLVNLVGDLGPKNPDLKPGETTSDWLDRVQNHIDPDHPYLQALATGLAGVDKDVAKTISAFSSPLSLALMGAGAATKVPGAVGTMAKAVTTAGGAGIAGKGVSDIASAGPLSTPEGMQQTLQGGAELTGGTAMAAPVVANAVSKAALLGKTPAEAYQSALKPSTTIPPAKVENMVQTGLQNEIPVSKSGAEKLSSLIEDLDDKVAAEIKASPGKTVDPNAVATRADQIRGKFANQVNPTADLQAIDASKQEFLQNSPSPIPADQAQAMKQGTYAQLKGKAYGELKSASIEAQKALARGLKEELEGAFPELHNLNAQLSKAYDLQPVLEKAIQREANHQIGGIGTPIVAAGTKAVTNSNAAATAAAVIKAVVDNPVVKSRLAIALNKSGVGWSAANARIAAYSGALASSAANTSNDESRESQPAQ
jgi:hypothetical protein